MGNLGPAMQAAASPRPAAPTAPPRRRVAVHVEGAVQGVGFRPHVYRLARALGLDGFVRTDGRGVVVEVEGAPPDVRDFLARLDRAAPPLATVERVSVRDIAPGGPAGFAIAA